MESLNDNSKVTPHISDYLAVVWRRKLLCLFVFLVLASAGLFVVVKVLKAKYQATARILIDRRQGILSERPSYANDMFYEAQYETMRSGEVAALAAFKLEMSPSQASAREDGTADTIRRAIAVAPEANPRIVRAMSRQKDPEMAAKLVNGLVDAYIEYAMRHEEELAGLRQKEINDQLRTLKAQVSDKKKAREEWSKDKDLAAKRRDESIFSKRLVALLEAQARTSVRRASAEAEYLEARSKLEAGEALAEYVPTPKADRIEDLISNMETQIRALKVNRTEKAWKNDPRYKMLDQELEEKRREYDDTVRQEHEEADSRMLSMRKQMFEEEEKTAERIDIEVENVNKELAELVDGLGALGKYNELTKEIDRLESRRDKLEDALLTAKLSGDTEVLNIQILDEAKPPTEPAWPNKTQLSVVVVALSLLMAAGLAFFLDYMDRTVRRPEDVEQELRMPFFGFVPAIHVGAGSDSRQERIMITDPTSGPAESYRKVRAKLNVYKNESHARTFAITSTTAGEGKTTVASNLAISFAQSGSNVLLVDADMRHPKVHAIYELERKPGLGNYLAGECEWGNLLRGVGVDGLSVLTAGASGTSSAELLEHPRMRQLLAEAAERHDVVIVDSPPVLGVADAAVISNAADATLFVIQAAQNSKWLIRRARMELKSADAKVVGAVLNRVRSQRGDYYYYHQYYPKKT